MPIPMPSRPGRPLRSQVWESVARGTLRAQMTGGWWKDGDLRVLGSTYEEGLARETRSWVVLRALALLAEVSRGWGGRCLPYGT